MCGIAGIFSLQEKISPRWVKSMTERIHHRGPDDEGYLGVDTRAGKVTQWGGKDSKVTLPSIDSVKDPNINLFFGHQRPERYHCNQCIDTPRPLSYSLSHSNSDCDTFVTLYYQFRQFNSNYLKLLVFVLSGTKGRGFESPIARLVKSST